MELLVSKEMRMVMDIMAETAEEVPMPAWRSIGRVNAISAVMKSDGTPVTEFDDRTEIILKQKLKLVLPEAVPFGEEGAGPGDCWKQSPLIAYDGYVLDIDPIDGTIPFQAHEPFAMMIGLRRGNEALFSIIYFPVTQEFLFASHEMTGAYRGQFEHGKLIGVRLPLIPVLPLEQMEIRFYADDKGNDGEATSLFGVDIVRQFGRGAHYDYCIATSMDNILNGKTVWVNANTMGKGYAPWDFGPTTHILRKAGGVALHLDGQQARISRQAANIVLAPSRREADLICTGYQRLHSVG